MSISIEIHRRPSSRGASYAGSLFLRVICDRRVSEITLPWRLHRQEWESDKHCVLIDQACPGRSAYLREVDSELTKTLSYLYAERLRLEQEGTLTAARLVAGYKTHRNGCRLKSWAEQLAAELERNSQIRTARAYRSATQRLLCFAGDDKLELKQLTPDLLCHFENALRREGRSENTLSFYMRMLRAIYNKAIDRGHLQPSGSNPFARVYTGVAQTPKRALSTQQMQSLMAINYKDGPLPLAQRTACALFLFSFWARGMSFVDLAFLRKTDIRGKLICYRRRKSGSRLEIPLTGEMVEIITWFAPMVEDSSFVFPLIQRPGVNEYHQYEAALRLQNKRLKALALSALEMKNEELRMKNGEGMKNEELRMKNAGKTRTKSVKSVPSNSSFFILHSSFVLPLSTHCARHSWSTMAKHELVPLSQISEALGHRSEKTTSIYLGSFNHSVWEEINRKIRKRMKKVG